MTSMDELPVGNLEDVLSHEIPIPGTNGATLGDFWKWGYSDVLVNTIRAVFGEYLVALALGIDTKPRIDWDSVDLRYGDSTIEVKTSSAIQAWPHPEGVTPSPSRFDIASHGRWDASSGNYSQEKSRWSDCYVFCLYMGPSSTPANDQERRTSVLNSDHWQFFVVATSDLDALGDQKSFSLSEIKKIWSSCTFNELCGAINLVVNKKL